MRTAYPRGSEWRRWDLHVHSPESTLCNDFAGWDTYLDALEKAPAELAAIGITDYATIEGYKHLLDERLKNGRVANIPLILPNIEFRVTPATRQNSGINIHLLVDPSDPEHVRRIEESLSRLVFEYQEQPFPCTPQGLTDLGLAHDKTIRADNAAKAEGCRQFKPSFNDFRKWYRSEGWLRENSICVVSNNSGDGASGLAHDDGFHATRREIYRFVDAIFSGNPNDRDYFLGLRSDTPEQLKESIGGLYPCIHGSDAHTESTLFQPAEDRFCWLKADPTFNGLRQIINEPSSRVWIGNEPPQLGRIQRSPTKIASFIGVHKLQSSTTSEIWFDADIPLNPGLVAIIGKKGSGKSALADILALVGDTDRAGGFSFLTKSRFREPRRRLAEHFEATLHWVGGPPSGPISLADDPSPESVRRVHYIPQSFLEQVCNDLSAGKRDRFYEELQGVIFSHIPEGERFGCSTLAELIEQKGEEHEIAIRALQDSLARVNSDIDRVTAQMSPSNRTSLETKYRAIWDEIQAVRDTGRPKKVPPPPEDPNDSPATRVASAKLKALRKRSRLLSSQTERIKAIRIDHQARAENARKLLGRIKNIDDYFKLAFAEVEEIATKLQIDPVKIVALKTDKGPVEAVRDRSIEVIAWTARFLDADGSDSIPRRVAEIEKDIRVENDKLSLPQRRYDAYLEALGDWRSQLRGLIGSVDTANSARALKANLDSLGNLPNALEVLKDERIDILTGIFNEKDALRREFETLHRPVQEFINQFPDFGGDARLSFSVQIQNTRFTDGFLEFIHQGRTGSFMGQDEGSSYVESLVDSADFQSAAGIKSFTESVVSALEFDQRLEEKPPRAVVDQLRESFQPSDLFNFVFGLEFLKPEFQIRWGGKPLGQLSPGEKGNLLLVFYLLVDRSEIPLIIDQPEENLDNETVFETLVPCVRAARDRRQVILVTHNPNLAVVCDADQIIHASIDKAAGNKVTYESGAIEEPIINCSLIDVLEGTRPAFDLRDAKYEISRS